MVGVVVVGVVITAEKACESGDGGGDGCGCDDAVTRITAAVLA